MAERRRLLVALLLTGRVASEIDGLRRATGSRELDRIPPHLTLVPPRNVAATDLETVLSTLRLVAARTAPLRLGLGPVATFPPHGRVVYLRVEDAADDVGALATALASGPLAPPQSRSSRPFVAHVTLTNRASEARAQAALVALACYRVAAEIATLSLLQMDEGVAHHPWRRLAEVALGAPTVRGRGGREVTVREVAPEDPDLAQFLDAARLAGTGDNREGIDQWSATTLTLGSWVAGRMVGAISGRLVGPLLIVEAHLVAAADRGLGIGSGLLTTLESVAAERGATRARLFVPANSLAAAYYAGRGYELVARVAAAPAAADEVLLARSLRELRSR